MCGIIQPSKSSSPRAALLGNAVASLATATPKLGCFCTAQHMNNPKARLVDDERKASKGAAIAFAVAVIVVMAVVQNKEAKAPAKKQTSVQMNGKIPVVDMGLSMLTEEERSGRTAEESDTMKLPDNVKEISKLVESDVKELPIGRYKVVMAQSFGHPSTPKKNGTSVQDNGRVIMTYTLESMSASGNLLYKVRSIEPMVSGKVQAYQPGTVCEVRDDGMLVMAQTAEEQVIAKEMK